MNSGKPQRVMPVAILSQACQAWQEGAETRWCGAISPCKTPVASSAPAVETGGDDIVQVRGKLLVARIGRSAVRVCEGPPFFKMHIPAKMADRLKHLLLSLCVLLTSACGSQSVYDEESFASDSPFKRHVEGSADEACESARRILLGQGFLIDTASGEEIKARKATRGGDSQNTFIEMNIVCLAEPSGSTLFATGLLSEFALKKSSSSASVGVSALGSISLPIGQSADSLVKVSEETINDTAFYKRFFAAVELLLIQMQAGKAALEPATAPQDHVVATTVPQAAPLEPDPEEASATAVMETPEAPDASASAPVTVESDPAEERLQPIVVAIPPRKYAPSIEPEPLPGDESPERKLEESLQPEPTSVEDPLPAEEEPVTENTEAASTPTPELQEATEEQTSTDPLDEMF